ncbi:hypothetical protein [Solilutibacter silvestris]|uniref:Uncharacterized protein n=1 Tax=Solilutibacter silvestris TaxID=1645665 RepID=A0A2K1Q3Y7_9GAMM|nr:hypothetical protein [Lysobacter silvestris]PNS09755.1 hypothetical protein Lysil_1384 [Lysobacter silvestris]
MALTKEQGIAAIDALADENKKQRTKFDLLARRRELINPPMRWRLTYFCFLLAVFCSFLLFFRKGIAFFIVIFMMSLAIFFGAWQKRIGPELREIEAQLKQFT